MYCICHWWHDAHTHASTPCLVCRYYRSALHDSCATLTILYLVFVLRQIRREFYIISRHDLLHKAITFDFAFPYGPIALNRFIMSGIGY